MMPESPATPLFVDPKSRRRAWQVRLAAGGGAVALLAAWAFLFLLLAPLPDAGPELFALAIPLVGFAAVLLFVAYRVRPLVVYTNGIGFPSRAGRRGRKAFVPYSELKWVYADLSNPLVGIKVGLRAGEVRRIPLHLLANPDGVLAAIRSVVSTAEEDLEMRALLEELDGISEAYLRLWTHRSAVRWQVAATGAVATATAIGTAIFVAFVLAADPVVWLVLLAAGFLAAGLVTWRVDRWLGPGDRAGLFTMVDTKTDVILPLLDRFFATSGFDALKRERRSILHERRRYEMPSLGASFRIYHVPGSEYSEPHWAASMRHTRGGEDRAAEFQKAFARFAVSVGLREVDPASLRDEEGRRPGRRRFWNVR